MGSIRVEEEIISEDLVTTPDDVRFSFVKDELAPCSVIFGERLNHKCNVSYVNCVFTRSNREMLFNIIMSLGNDKVTVRIPK